MEDLAKRFADYLAARMPDASDLDVSEFTRIPGGASRETYRATVSYRKDGREIRQGMILRRDPTSSLIDTERELEYRAYVAMQNTDVPVPKPLFLEQDARWLDRAFFVMEEISGCESGAAAIGQPPYDEHREQLGRRKWAILGHLASLDPTGLGLDDVMEVPALDQCAARELAYWESVIDEDELSPQPIARATIRWLRRNLPAPAQKLAVVHGDYRIGNFLYDRAGEIRGILDWEMCHLGDPLEDLAWSLDPLWCWPDKSLAGHLLPRSEAIDHWQRVSGLRFDPEAFRWWQVFAAFKGLAIWISSCRDYADGEHKAPITALAGWFMSDRHNRILLDYLSPHSEGRYTETIA
ncbi:MAG: phosphotransferase family protein [Pseudomonadales bacterium]